MSKIIHNMQTSYRRKRYQWQFTIGGLVAALIIFGLLGWYSPFPIYLGWLIAISLISFIYFGWDKMKARNDSDVRIPEVVLHILNLAGGFIGGFVGMQLFRHKTDFSKHYIFPTIIGLAAVLHGVLYWFVLR